jgi:hypothetical protein
VGAYLAIAIFLLLVGGLFIANYRALLALLAGIVLAWPARTLFIALREHARSQGWPWWVWFIPLPVILLLLLCLLLLLLFPGLGSGPGDIEVEVKSLHMTIEPVDTSLKTFWLEEELVLDLSPLEPLLHADVQPQMRLPRRQVAASKQGWLLREVRFQVPPSVTLRLVDNVLTNTLFIYADTQVSVELRDMPLKSFYAAQDAQDLETYPYIDTETITWRVLDPDRGISFAFVQPPYQRFRGVLKPFLGASSLGEWLLGLVGIVGSAIVFPIFKDVLFDVAGDKVKAWLEKRLKRKKKRTPQDSHQGKEPGPGQEKGLE